MTYSVLSRGRLIGVTELEGVFREMGVRSGAFIPNELGEASVDTQNRPLMDI